MANEKIMTSDEFVLKVKDIAQNRKTLYVLGCIGAPLNEKTFDRYTSNYPLNSTAKRKAMIADAVKKGGYFGFDCVCLIKSVLWG